MRPARRGTRTISIAPGHSREHERPVRLIAKLHDERPADEAL
jgi:hypothetical protein